MNSWSDSSAIMLSGRSLIRIKHQVNGILSCLQRNLNLHPQIQVSTTDLSDVWNPPDSGSWKLNCDGSVNISGRSAGCGGVLRDSNGAFVFAFSQHLEDCNILEAELKGILHGIRIARNRGFFRLVVESDSSDAFDLLTGGGSY